MTAEFATHTSKKEVEEFNSFFTLQFGDMGFHVPAVLWDARILALWKYRLKKGLHSLLLLRANMRTKRVIIVINLIEESIEEANEEIEKEILRELIPEMPIIRWVENVEKITVIEESPKNTCANPSRLSIASSGRSENYK